MSLEQNNKVKREFTMSQLFYTDLLLTHFIKKNNYASLTRTSVYLGTYNFGNGVFEKRKLIPFCCSFALAHEKEKLYNENK